VPADDDRTAAWRIDAADYPADGPRAAQLRFAVGYAVLAPSGHNTQPWRFAVAGDTVAVRADRTRALPVADPDRRELVISCGAALFHLRVALHRFGHAAAVTPLPDPADPDLLAVVRVEGPAAPDAGAQALFEAIPQRHTNRAPFDDRPLPADLRGRLQDAAAAEGACLALVDRPEQRERLAGLVAAASRRQMADPAFRAELARWMRPHNSRRGDGLHTDVLGMPALLSYVLPALVRRIDTGRSWARRDAGIAAAGPVLAVVGSDGDAPADWLAAGQGLAHLLLAAAAAGVSASYLNQAVQDPDGRRGVAAAAPGAGTPHLLLRLGYGPPAPPAPRRPPAEVLTGEPA